MATLQKTCCVRKCRSSSKRNSGRSFFPLPTDAERRLQWTQLIGREDLMDKTNIVWSVCDLHFHISDILPGTRPLLKETALPQLLVPKIGKKDAETDSLKFLDKYTQTKKSEPSSRKIRNWQNTFYDRSRKKKLTSDLKDCRRYIELLVTGKPIKKRSKGVSFHKLCQKELTKDLATLAEAVSKINCNYLEKKNPHSFKKFCFILYYANPRAYKSLRSAINLPNPKCFTKREKITTQNDDRIMRILKSKADHMTDDEKNCSVTINTIKLRTNLYYNIGQDKIIGFQEINGVQTPKPAQDALVVMLRGIFSNWKQPVGYALLSEQENHDKTLQWFYKLLENLIEIGFNIRTIIIDKLYKWCDVEKKKSIDKHRPYFTLNNKEIYYIFDIENLITSMHNCLMKYDFSFHDQVVKYEHIVKFFEIEKYKDFKLAPKLTDDHIHSNSFNEKEINYAIDIFDNSVAEAMLAYIEFDFLDESARGTVNFIKIIHKLLERLSSLKILESNEYGRAFFIEMLSFFQSLKIIDPKNGHDVTSVVTFIFGFEVTINSILGLFEDLELEGHNIKEDKHIFTRKLNEEALKRFFRQIKITDNSFSTPTARQFVSTYHKLYFIHLNKLPKPEDWIQDLKKYINDEKLVRQDSAPLVKNYKKSGVKDNVSHNKIKIKQSEYNQIDFSKKSLIEISSELLSKCSERHKDCNFLKKYNKADRCLCLRAYYSAEDKIADLPVIPCDDFVYYVEEMDEKFREYFNNDNINIKIAESIYKEIDEIGYKLPCPCFPKEYLNILFIRMRIFNTIRFNNRLYRQFFGSRSHFSINSL